MTERKTFTQNMLWNLLGSIAPLVIAVVAFPYVLDGLGLERFGLLTLIWALIGYFNLFDLGLGTALTKLIAERRENKASEIPGLIRTALWLLFSLSLVAVSLVWLITDTLIYQWLNIEVALQDEAHHAFLLLACALPFVILVSGLRGILEAYGAFRQITLIRLPLGVFIFIAPLLVLPFTHNLVPIVALLLIGRIVACALYLFFCLQHVPELREDWRPVQHFVKPLVHFGGWITVGGIVGPLMVYFDRFIIGAILTLTAVSYYVTPYELVSKLWVLPGAILAVVFPAMSAAMVNDRQKAVDLYKTSQKLIVLMVFPISVALVLFAEEGMTLWLGADFAEKSYPILQIFAIGTLINCTAWTAAALIRACGHPDRVAILNCIELPFYLLGLWILTNEFGLYGAASAWFFRLLLNAIALYLMAVYHLKGLKRTVLTDSLVVTSLIAITVLVMITSSVLIKTCFVVITVLVAAYLLYRDVVKNGLLSNVS